MPILSGSRSAFSTMPMAASSMSPWPAACMLMTTLQRSKSQSVTAAGTPTENRERMDSAEGRSPGVLNRSTWACSVCFMTRIKYSVTAVLLS